MAAQEGAMVKRLHACLSGPIGGAGGALLGQRGFTGILDVLEAGYGGFLSAFSGRPDASQFAPPAWATSVRKPPRSASSCSPA